MNMYVCVWRGEGSEKGKIRGIHCYHLPFVFGSPFFILHTNLSEIQLEKFPSRFVDCLLTLLTVYLSGQKPFDLM